ncbi:MAG: PadR family transcriptional regulator [archaeon]|nr:PadR family transcriptional regulator [archaeon]
MVVSKHQQTRGTFAAHFLQKPQGAPRGLLLFYILHRISLRPTHGYEIAQDIEEKTEGAWRPAPGSIYPMLKKLTNEGLIRVSSTKSRSSETAQRVYEITPEGSKCLKDGKNMFANAGQRWTAMRRIFMDLMDPSQISEFLTQGSKLQFQLSQELIETKVSKLPQSDAEFTLKEYALNLERQLNWTNTKLSQFDKKTTAPTAQVKTSR